MKKITSILIFILALILIWGVISTDNISISVSGKNIEGPLEIFAGLWETLIAAVILFCIATILTCVMTGVGIIILGVTGFTILLPILFMFPFFTPILIPLFILWGFVSWHQSKK